jgi:chemotaxis protein histidine kinase CheA
MPSSSSSSSQSERGSGGGMTIDIRPMIEDVSQVMTKHITSILSGVIGEYTIYKETHDTIMGLPCVRKLQERISELEQHCGGGEGGGASMSASSMTTTNTGGGSREEEVAQLQSAIADLNRYIHALESKVDMKSAVSSGDGGHIQQQHHHPDEESVRLEIHETDDCDEGEGEGDDHCESNVETSSTHKNVIITTEALEETETEAEEPEDADAEAAEQEEAEEEAEGEDAEDAEADAEAEEAAEAAEAQPEPEAEEAEADAEAEDAVPEKDEILGRLRENPERYLSERALAIFSPKMLKILKNVQESLGERGNWNNQFLYSQYKSLEGIGVFTAILDANGWQPYRIVQDDTGQWIEDPTLDPAKPAYALFTGGEGMIGTEVKSDFSTVRRDAIKRSAANSEVREYMRQIFNAVGFSDNFPASLRASVESSTDRTFSERRSWCSSAPSPPQRRRPSR